jgi:hypothetical protein
MWARELVGLLRGDLWGRRIVLVVHVDSANELAVYDTRTGLKGLLLI